MINERVQGCIADTLTILIENIDRNYMVNLPVVEIIVYLIRVFVL